MACEYNSILNNIENMLSKLSANQKGRDDIKPLIRWLNEAKVIGSSNENFDKDLPVTRQNLKEAFTYTVYPKAKPDMVKAKYKASKATKYVGYGKAGSSTELYAKQLSEQGMPINTGEYNEKDVVFVSVNGTPNREDYVNTLKQVIAALESGATVLTDSESYLSKSTYNKGEIQLAKNLMNRGYTRETSKDNNLVGVWTKPKKEDSKITRIKFNRDVDTYYTKNQIAYRRHRFIDKVDNKKSRITKNVVNSLLKILYHSEIRTEKDVSDLNELFKPYPEIYTEDVKRLIEKIQKHTNNKFKKHTLKEWSDIYYKEKDIKKEIDYTRKIIGDKFGFKEFIQSDEVESYEFGFSAQFVKTSKEEKSTIEQTKQQEISPETKLKQLLEAYSTGSAPKIGGGLVEDVTWRETRDEDKPKATMMKGSQEEALKDMLPKIDGRKLSKYKKVVNAWDGKSESEIIKELLELLNTVEQEPRLAEEFGWDTVATKQEDSIIFANDIIKAAQECAKG